RPRRASGRIGGGGPRTGAEPEGHNARRPQRRETPARARTRGRPMMRAGAGFDLHPLVAGRPPVRGGVSAAARRGPRRASEARGRPMMRAGLGFDLHPLVAGRSLVLGGVSVAAERGLDGHSDADVLTHAICEGALGALALGDLGRLFPDTDPRYAGISSLSLLRSVVQLITTRGALFVNVDATVISQSPRLAPYLDDMSKRVAETLGIDVDRVSIKAKSPEHLGLLGREEGIAAMAVVTVELP